MAAGSGEVRRGGSADRRRVWSRRGRRLRSHPSNATVRVIPEGWLPARDLRGVWPKVPGAGDGSSGDQSGVLVRLGRGGDVAGAPGRGGRRGGRRVHVRGLLSPVRRPVTRPGLRGGGS